MTKKKLKSEYLPLGRPPSINSVVLAKLEQAYSLGCSDGEACLYAGINPATLYKYQQKHPDFIERKNLLKKKPVLLARKTVIKGMQKDPNLAMKFLEKRKRDEFGSVQTIDITMPQINKKEEALLLELQDIKTIESEDKKLLK